MTTATLRIPAKSTQISGGRLGYGVDILAQVRLDTLADALRSMEHDDTDPGEKRMNADQCRDALLRELLGGWTTLELIAAKIPAVLELADLLHECREMLGKQADEITTLRRERDEARARAAGWTWNIPSDGLPPIIEGDHTMALDPVGDPDEAPPSIADCREGFFVQIAIPTPGTQA